MFREILIDKIESYLKTSDTTPTVFGRLVMNDGNFVFQLRDGRDIRSRTAQRVSDFIDQNLAA